MFGKLITSHKYAVQQPQRISSYRFRNHISHQTDISLPQIISLCASSLSNPTQPPPHFSPPFTAQTKMQNFCNNIIIFFLSCIAFIIVCRIFYCLNNNWTKANVQLLLAVCLYLSVSLTTRLIVIHSFFFDFRTFIVCLLLLACWKLTTRRS